MSVYEGPLGRLEPTDDRHLQRYSLTADTIPKIPTPVGLGLLWYSAFDRPQQDSRGRFWLPNPRQDWGGVRGGHAICLKPSALRDQMEWWTFYNQGVEGACVGYSLSRMMTLLNRTRYLGHNLYKAAQAVDEWPGDDYEGTSVRAGCDVLRSTGPYLATTGYSKSGDGISANRWARDVKDIAACLEGGDPRKVLNKGYVQMLNSWGQNYPHLVHISLDTLERLIFREGGDATVVTDR